MTISRKLPKKVEKYGPCADALRVIALSYSGVEEGIACAGAAVESLSFKVKKKTFLLVRSANVMLKLRESLPEAGKLQSTDPERYRIGAGGWVTINLDPGQTAAPDLLEGWIGESHRISAASPAPYAKKKSATK